MADYKNTIDFIKSVYGNQEFTPLAVPVFIGNEKKYLNECIDTTFVSSVGNKVNTVLSLLVYIVLLIILNVYL